MEMHEPTLLCNDPNFAVVDDLLTPDMFAQFWEYYNQLPFQHCSHEQWLKVWKLSDGDILRSPTFFHSKSPFNGPMDLLHKYIFWLAPKFSHLIGEYQKDWDEIQLTPYLYPMGAKISWHDDVGYTGACIFYAHPKWSAHWGGELFVAKTEEKPCTQEKVVDTLSREQHSDFLNKYGVGHYIVAKPNRLVFTKGSAWHSVNRVDHTAGDNVRCSVVGFFTKRKQ
jgi:hypothetical protein